MSLGVLTAVTGRERARSWDSTAATFTRTIVAPPSGYGVARLQQEFGTSRSVVGATFTGVQRDLPSGSPLLGLYNRSAYTGGVDWDLRWNRGTYRVFGWLGFSDIRGDTASINRVQRSAVHFFQRPDADHVRFDSSRTRLSGTIANLGFRKANGTWLYGVEGGWESPGFDPNDAGRLGNADGRFAFANLRYRQTQPRGVFQNYAVGLFTGTEWNFGGDRQFLYAELGSNMTFRNFWNIDTYFDFYPRAFDQSATRGGPTMMTPQAWNYVFRLANSFGAKTSWTARVYYGEDELGGETYRLSGGLSVRPSTRFQLSVTPNYLRAINPRQYIDSASGGSGATYGTRFLFSVIDQSTFLLQLRANYTLAPELTLELYAEPFAASGRYYGIGELAAPRTYRLREYGTSGTTIARDSVGDYLITDNGGADTVLVANPDFNVLSFQSNAVLRWEWRPGSTLFLVWQQSRGAGDSRGTLVRPRNLYDALRAPGDNFLAVKVSYWLPVR
jgi:hypothetical protein